MSGYREVQINAGELIERLERNHAEWTKMRQESVKRMLPQSALMARHIAQGIEEAIQEVKELAK